MAGAPELGPPSSPSRGILELYFSGSRQGVRLQHLDPSGVDSHREQSFRYRLALERKEALAWHLGARLVNDSFEDGFRKVFGASKPSLVVPDCEVDVSSPSWVDVLRDIEPSRLPPDVNGTRHHLVRGTAVDLSASDCEIIRSGLFQKFIEPWPHPQDLQAEIEAVEATLRRLSTWKQNVLQALQEDEALARGLQERLISIRHHMALKAEPKSQQRHEPAATSVANLQHNVNREPRAEAMDYENPMDGLDCQSEESTHQRSEASDIEDHGDEVYQTSEDLQEANEELPRLTSTPGVSTASMLRWSYDEESRLLPFLERHKHLSWPEIEQEYLRQTGIYRREPALRTKARRIREKGLRGARKTQTRRGRKGGSLIVSLPLPLADRSSGSEGTHPTSRVSASASEATPPCIVPPGSEATGEMQKEKRADTLVVSEADEQVSHIRLMLSGGDASQGPLEQGKTYLNSERPLSLDHLLG